MKTLRKAVILAAGRGTRFLPFSKAVPKEMLPVIDTPSIQLIAEEAVEAGIREILIVDSPEKHALMQHFAPDEAWDAFLHERHKDAEIEKLHALEHLAKFCAVSQKKATGSADAVLLSKEFAAGEPIVVLNGDDVMYTPKGNKTVTRQLVECFEEVQQTVIGVQTVTPQEISKYGAVNILERNGRTYRIDSIVEKPSVEAAPSFVAALGRYVISGDFYGYLERISVAANGEKQFTDALKLQAAEKGIYAYDFEGTRYDLGDKFGFVRANVEAMLRSEKYGEQMRAYLASLEKE